MPENSHVGVSQRIESEEERARLKALVEPFVMNSAVLLFVPPQKGKRRRITSRR